MRNDGGAAFPVIPPRTPAGNVTEGYPFPAQGMTLRDYFAAKAMQAYLSSYPCQSEKNPSIEIDDDMLDAIAADSFYMADAMLKARESSNE